MELQPPDRLRYSLSESAAMLGISRQTLWRRINDGHLATVNDGRRVFITAAELQRYSSASVAS